MSEKRIDLIGSIQDIVNGFFSALFDYAKLHPVIAMNITACYFDVMSELVKDSALEDKRKEIAIHLQAVAGRINAQLVSEIFVQSISPVTHIIDHQLAGFSAAASTEKLLGGAGAGLLTKDTLSDDADIMHIMEGYKSISPFKKDFRRSI
jgi:hypothetical protein